MSEMLSAKGKIWQLPSAFELSADFLTSVGEPVILAKILRRRGIDSPEKARSFLSQEHYIPTDPFELPDMGKAVARINQGLFNNEQITVYGDYDVDGVTATSLLLTGLHMLKAKVNYYIPNRATEGYGLNLKAVSILASKQQAKLLITCDCGVSNFAEINFAKSLGVDTIVLDHHALPELLPPARAIVHPKLLTDEHPLFHLPGVGVAYKVIEALLNGHGLSEQVATFLDYVTLGMIADLVPLISENRYLVQLGLPRLISSTRPGIKALLAQVGPSKDTDIVGFGLAPRINAVGRLADANVAVELLTTNDNTIANKLSIQLQNENTKRQEICERVLLEAEQVIANDGINQQNAIVIYKEGWHHGVVGIVASRLVEKYHKPIFIAELDSQEGLIKGSARGIESLNLTDILKANAHLLNKWGGHKMAAGFSLLAEKGEAFRSAIVATCNHMMANILPAPIIRVDALLDDINSDLFALAKDLHKLAPFGMENKKPLFYATKLTCNNVAPLGRQNKHHRLDIEDKESKKAFSCVFWNTHNIIPNAGEIIDIVFTPEINVFNGIERLQLVLADWRLSGKNDQVEVHPTANNVQVDCTPTPVSTAIAAVTISAASSSSSADPELAKPKIVWQDLRHYTNIEEVLGKATAQLGQNLAIFSEQTNNKQSPSIFDRLTLPQKPHLLISQFPPSIEIWQQIITTSGAKKIYLIGEKESEQMTNTAFIKRLLGLVRFVVNKKSGNVEAKRISTALATTDVASALGLALLRKLEIIDWYSDEGIIYFDILENTNTQEIKQFTEYHQLEKVLQQINTFRNWCMTAAIKELQQAIYSRTDKDSKIDHSFEIVNAQISPSISGTEGYAYH